MKLPPFLDLPAVDPPDADVLLLPLPFEGTVSYGRGTSRGPEAIWRASAEVECWDEELDFDLDSLRFARPPAVVPAPNESPGDYLRRVLGVAAELHRHGGLVLGIGGEHSLTPPLVTAAAGGDDLSGVTIVQFDAHADLRERYHDTPHSHACAMRRLVERGAKLLAVGIRSAERAEHEYALASGRVTTFFAHQLVRDTGRRRELLLTLGQLEGDVYLTIDVDVLDVALCPATGTPQPGGLLWWPALEYLRRLLWENSRRRLIGVDVVETVPSAGTQVNEFTSARLIAKLLAYCFAGAAHP